MEYLIDKNFQIWLDTVCLFSAINSVAEEANFDWSGKITGKICLMSEKEKELCHHHPIIQRVTLYHRDLFVGLFPVFFLQLLYYGILV